MALKTQAQSGLSPATKPSSTSRRSFLRKVSGIAAAVMVGGGELVATQQPAMAASEGCCSLARPSDYYCMYYCGSGTGPPYTRYWNCRSGGYVCRCFECTPSSNCYTGPFHCSYASC